MQLSLSHPTFDLHHYRENNALTEAAKVIYLSPRILCIQRECHEMTHFNLLLGKF